MISSLKTAHRRALLPVAAAFLIAVPAAPSFADVPYVPTPMETVKRMLEIGEVQKDEFVIDLGSGDGRIAIMAAQDFGARALGVDINPQRIKEANENATKAGVTDRVEFREENLFQTDISKADVITMYLLTSVNAKLRPRLLEELRPGVRLVSHAFDMGSWEPEMHDQSTGRSVYLWIVPARAEGTWTLQDGDRKFTLNLEQEFQMLKGTASVNGKEAPVTNARLRGADIVFTVEVDGKPETFQGRVDGDKIEGTDGNVATRKGWTATRG